MRYIYTVRYIYIYIIYIPKTPTFPSDNFCQNYFFLDDNRGSRTMRRWKCSRRNLAIATIGMETFPKATITWRPFQSHPYREHGDLFEATIVPLCLPSPLSPPIFQGGGKRLGNSSQQKRCVLYLACFIREHDDCPVSRSVSRDAWWPMVN